MLTKVLKPAVWVILMSLSLATPVKAAYIDPNTGGMLFQILAVLFGLLSGLILFFSGKIRMTFFRLKRFLRDFRAPRENETESKG